MKINDKVIINSKDWHCGNIGIIKQISEKTTNVGLELEGYSKIVWFFESDLKTI